MEDNLIRAIVTYLLDLGFDFHRNSARDLIYSVNEIKRLMDEDEEIRKGVEKYLEVEKCSI